MMIPLFKVLMTEQAKKNALDVLSSGYVAQGPKVDEFESKLSEWVNESPVTVNSGTSALTLALVLANVGPEDEVITTPQSCVATNAAIIHLGAKPVWTDIDPLTGLIDPKSISSRITYRTKAVMTVDWGGHLCDYEEIRRVLSNRNRKIPIIEDAAHAFNQKLSENSGDYICWSYQAIKCLSTVDGGAVLPPNDQAARARKLRWFGFDRTSKEDFRSAQRISEIGYKWHMNDLNAAIGLGNLPAAIESLDSIRENADYYTQRLQEYAGDHLIALPPYLTINPSWWLYTILVSDRESFTKFMARRGIQVSQVHTRNDIHPACVKAAGESFLGEPYYLPGVDYFDKHQVSIPVGFWLTEETREIVANAVEDWVQSRW